jgi:hypothetical protein
VHSVKIETPEIIVVIQGSVQRYKITENDIELYGCITSKSVNWIFSRGMANGIIKFKGGMKGDVVGIVCSAHVMHVCVRGSLQQAPEQDNIQIFSHLLSCSACVIGLDMSIQGCCSMATRLFFRYFQRQRNLSKYMSLRKPVSLASKSASTYY